MKRYLIIVIILASACSKNMAQTSKDSIPMPPCQQIEIPEGKRGIINDFIKDCIKHREFINNKGIVHLTEYTNSDGLLCWQLSCDIDDSYKKNPPTKFADFDGDIVLVYEANSVGRENQNSNAEAYNKCLEEVIGDRVYLRPAINTRWSSSVKNLIIKGQRMKRGKDRLMFDNGVGWSIVFYKDGKHKIFY